MLAAGSFAVFKIPATSFRISAFLSLFLCGFWHANSVATWNLHVVFFLGSWQTWNTVKVRCDWLHTHFSLVGVSLCPFFPVDVRISSFLTWHSLVLLKSSSFNVNRLVFISLYHDMFQLPAVFFRSVSCCCDAYLFTWTNKFYQVRQN